MSSFSRYVLPFSSLLRLCPRLSLLPSSSFSFYFFLVFLFFFQFSPFLFFHLCVLYSSVLAISSSFFSVSSSCPRYSTHLSCITVTVLVLDLLFNFCLLYSSVLIISSSFFSTSPSCPRYFNSSFLYIL